MDKIYFVLIGILVASCLIVALPFIVSYAKENKKGVLKLSNCEILHELEFGGVYVKITIEDFNKLGFEFGDSVNISFSNGYKYRNIPYYNGYYTKTGDPQLLGYPGYKYLKVAISNGEDLWNMADLDINKLAGEQNLLWDTFNLDENVTVTITLAEKGKYLDIQNARDIHYFDDRELYDTNEVFANFREMKGGNLKENYFYRGASPCDNQHKRVQYVDELMKQTGIKYIINLADTDEKILSYMQKQDFKSPYFQSLYNQNDNNNFVMPLALNMNYGSKYFITQTKKAMLAILNNDGPFYIHCTEGKDRTGYVCMLIEALAGASYQEIVNDYMLTYRNYYGIESNSKDNKYSIIVENVLDPMIQSFVGKKSVDIKTANIAEYAKKFLIKNGLTKEQVADLIEKITKKQ